MSDRASPFVPNPILGGLLGLGVLAAAARDLASGLALGAGAAISALILGAIVPPLRRQLPERFRAPASLAISVSIASVFGLLLEAYMPLCATGLWIYVPLLSVNCLGLQAIRLSASQDERRAEGASRYGAVAREAAGYFLVACLLGALREAAGIGTLTLPSLGQAQLSLVLIDRAPLRLLSAPAGGLILLGFMTALYRIALRAGGRRIP
jgi:electron transport complex protein RnfE